MINRNIRIFIGPTEVCNVNAILADAFRRKGMTVTVVSIGYEPYQDGMKYDKVLVPNIRHLNIFLKIFCYLYCWFYCVNKFTRTHDAFIFQYGDSLLPFNLDLPLMKLSGKKTIMQFMGDDIRYYKALEDAAKKAGLKYYLSDERLKIERKASFLVLQRKKTVVFMAEKFATHIISSPQYSQLLSRPYYRIELPVDINNIQYNNRPNTTPIIVHAPSEDAFKGTSLTINAIEKLKNEGYNFEFRLFRNISNIEVRKNLSSADIAVDQLFAFTAGMFAIEAMAAGCAVLGGNVTGFSGAPEDLPVIHTNPDNIYSNLKMLLESPGLRQDLGKKGREYVERHHNPDKIADNYISLIISGVTEAPRYPVSAGS